MPIYTPALDLIVNLADRQASGRLTLSGSRVVAGVSPAPCRIVLGDTGLCRVRAVVPNLSGERAFDDVDLSTSTVRIALGVPGEDPYCLATLSDPSPAAAAQVTSPQSATADLPATKRITLDPAPYGGSFIVTIDDLPPIEFPYDAEPDRVQAALGLVYAVRKVAGNAWEISGTTANQDVTIAVDPSGLLVPLALAGVIAINTDKLAAAFAAAASGTPPSEPKWLRVYREVEIDGVKVFQDDKVEIARAVLDLSSQVPTPLPPSDVAAINTALAGKQPIDADLTAIAALSTTAWGRTLLTLADAGALRTYAAVQPLNSGLTSISSLPTADYGRGLLTQPDAASVRSYIGATFANLPDKPTTVAGYGITDFNSLGDARWSPLGHTHAFAELTSKPTTIAGYGITDFNSLGDARWPQLSGAYANPSWISSLPFAKLTATPTTIAGYGITDFNSLGDARWPQLSGSYPDPAWITTLAAPKLTGTIADDRLSANVPLLAATINAFAGSQTIGGYLKVSSAGLNIGNPVAFVTDPLLFDTGGMHIWIPFSKDGPCSGNTGLKIFSANDFVGGAETYLQGTFALITATDPLDRRLKLGCTEQGTAQRNITLAEDGGFVGIGVTRPLVQFQITSGPAPTGGIEMVRLEGGTLANGWTRSLTFTGQASGSLLEVGRIDSYLFAAERHLRFYAGGTLGLDLWQHGGVQIGGDTRDPGAGCLQLTSAANATGYTEMFRLEGSTISNGFERGIGFWGNNNGIEIARLSAYVTGAERHARLYVSGTIALTARETGDVIAARDFIGTRNVRAVAFVCSGIPPATENGMIYFDPNDLHFYGWNGTAWKQLDN